MKRLKQWFVKLDTIWIMLFALVILVYAYTREADASIKLYYTTFGIPIFLFLLQVANLKI